MSGSLLPKWALALSLIALMAAPPGCVRREAGANGASSERTAPSADEEAPLEAGRPLDLSHLSDSARTELETVMSDEFCYCGCPHTLGACLREHPGCTHAPRMLRLAAAEAAVGAPAVETIVSLQRYYGAFREPRSRFQIDPRQCRGAAMPKVEVVEFSDFECPYCAAARPMLEAWAQKHASTVRLCVVPFPLQMHPNAIPAGQAALFARDQGKFWQMHEALFEHSMTLSTAEIVRLGRSIGLDGAKLEALLRGEDYQSELRAMKEMGQTAGVTATPMVYFNGRKMTLPLGPTLLSHTLSDELEWIAHDGAWQAD